jgi:hypothetical protein
MTASRTITRLQDLDDVNAAALGDAKQLQYDAASGKHKYVNPQPPLTSGRYYFVPNSLNTPIASLGNGNLRLIPFYVPAATTLSRIGGEVTVVGDAASVVRLGIYADDGTFRPGALVIDAGTISGNSATVQEITINTQLPAGWYWTGGAVQNVTTTQPTVRCVSSYVPQGVDTGTLIPAAAASILGRIMTGVTGALPANFVDAGTHAGVPRLFVKVA